MEKMNEARKLSRCLSACLTILVKKDIIQEEDAASIIEKEGLDGLFDLLNNKFIEIQQDK